MANNKFPREISLCLSGGAAKGAFHLGVIDVLQEYGIEIKAISGTSIGALIGASIASGKSPKVILEILKSKAFRNIFKLHLGHGYLYKIDMQSSIISDLVKYTSFEELHIPFELALTNVGTAQVEYYSRGNKLHQYILASCAISPIIQAQKIDGNLYIDGGLIDNFPIQVLKKYPYKIFGVNLYPHTTKEPKSLVAWIKKTIFIAWQAPNIVKRQKCDYYLSSDLLNEISMFSFKDIDKAYKLGREEMKNKQHLWKL